MLKGISHQIVEITDTENPFFSRALLVVRDSCAECPSDRLEHEAHSLLDGQSPYSALRRRRLFTRLGRIGLLLAGTGIGGTLAWLWLR